jgi:hypothetical integral membrane protein (TIGR02206 family)
MMDVIPTHLPIICPMPITIAVAFHAFNTQHIITLGAISIAGILVVWMAGRGTPLQRKWMRLILAFLLLGYAASFYIPQALRHTLNWQYSLPLELCNLILIACIIALLRPIRIINEIVYFLGAGGVLQATLTPDLGQGFPSWDFTLFFWGHGVALLAILFLISSREFKPGKGSIVRMMIALNIYGLIVGVIDAVFKWNYGYLCQKPSRPSLLDLIGPWPWYLLSIEAIALLTFLILDLPWRILALRKSRAARAPF